MDRRLLAYQVVGVPPDDFLHDHRREKDFLAYIENEVAQL